MTEGSIFKRRQQLAEELEWKQGLLRDYDIADEQTVLSGCRAIIKKKSERRSEVVRDELPSMQTQIEVADALLMTEINRRLDDNGKPLPSNAETRKAMLVIELSADRDYQARIAHRADLQMELDAIDAELDLETKRYAATRQGIEQKIAMLRVLAL